ncbi:expressed unknown protein [Seminavis robusta]|uniref:Pyridoxamine 5'-phosphate oxidase Alr4036 family FMN-binding domain-containing protein n=1 Tax=Seminavis robusta TaxID=568900 RepID=A0A9N8H7Y1_9STRA|nr:expressed unknown protein [Seminavis robusta]|eukprot:Sro142_g066360.1 n/a (301) ;mRNA; f:82782-83684
MMLLRRLLMLYFSITSSALTRNIGVFGLTAFSRIPLSLSTSSAGQNFCEAKMSNSPTTAAEASDETTHTRDLQQQDTKDKDPELGQKSWRSLIEISMARSRKIRGSNYVQLATVDLEAMEPRCRTVVFRGFQKFPADHKNNSGACDDLSTVLKMCTDARSRKVQESPAGEIVWWFAKSSEQYRMRGKLLYVGGQNDGDDPELSKARKELWGNLSDPARESFFDQNVPGAPTTKTTATNDESAPAGGRDASAGKPLPPPDNFLLMLLFPHHVDYLNLKENYRQVDTFSKDESSWSFQQVNA